MSVFLALRKRALPKSGVSLCLLFEINYCVTVKRIADHPSEFEISVCVVLTLLLVVKLSLKLSIVHTHLIQIRHPPYTDCRIQYTRTEI